MEVWEIPGAQPLRGTVRVSGAKNAALPMMAAALLSDEPLVLRGVPRVRDVGLLAEVLRELDVVVATDVGAMHLCSRRSSRTTAEYPLVRQLRASVCVLGPLLARRRRAMVALPGGCRLGARPIDLHLRGFATLGAKIRIEGGYVVAHTLGLTGGRVDLLGPRGSTVTGTANILCAATLARGETLIEGAAQEPEIIALAEMLVTMGARIEGHGTATIRVRGVDGLRGADCSIMPDRIEAATWLTAAAITGGDMTVANVRAADLAALIELFARAGATIETAGDRIRLRAQSPLQAVDYVARPFPGLPTDLQPLWTALLTQARGRGAVVDRVFPERFAHLAELARLGARLEQRGARAVVRGPRRLMGTQVRAADLRGAAALLVAALAASGTTRLEAAELLHRGYEDLQAKLGRLGVTINVRRDSLHGGTHLLRQA